VPGARYRGSVLGVRYPAFGVGPDEVPGTRHLEPGTW